ncbi:MAG: hypothetical protein LBK99_16085 [Opitutaceae bacterium]|jgi:hypothetical protein|nr:hypothetical protein [Opitutaceae bacterium]
MSNDTFPQRRTFAELYCEDRHLDPEDFEESVVRETLHPAGRLLYPFLRRIAPDFFTPDYDLARAAGHLRRMRDFPMEAWEYGHHPKNSGLLRRVLGVRVSVGLFRQVIRHTLHSRLAKLPDHATAPEPVGDGTIAPFIMDPVLIRLPQRDSFRRQPRPV